MDFNTLDFNGYNTAEAYNDKGSTAKGLVAAYKRDNPTGTKEDFLSKLHPSWNTENVKKELKAAFPDKKETVSEKEIVEEKTKTPNPIDPKDKQFLTSTNAVADQVYEDVKKDNEKQAKETQTRTKEQIINLGANHAIINDHFIDQLPTTMTQRYKNGEFGEVGSKDAKLRLAHFMVDAFGNSLKHISNAFMQASGKSPMFTDIKSDYQKYQESNLAQGMENRWNKYKAETAAAVELAKNTEMNKQDIQNNLQKIQSDRKMNTAWNMMDQKQKLYTLKLYEQAGDELDKLTPQERTNFIWGAFTMGDDFTPSEAAVVLGSGLVNKLFDENGNIDPSNVTDALKDVVGGGVGSGVISAGNGGKGNTYNSELSLKGSTKDKVMGMGNVNLSDQTLDRYFALSTKTPSGITTELPNADAIKQTIKDYGKDSVLTVVSKSGIKKSIDKQFSEIDKLASNATKDYKKSGDLAAYQARLKELSDYRNELEGVYKTLGYRPLPGNSIESDYDKAFGQKEETFRNKYTK